MLLDEFTSRLNSVAHEDSEDFIGSRCIFHANLQQCSLFGIHTGIPKFLRVHFAETFEACQRQAFFTKSAEFSQQIAKAGQLHDIVIAFQNEREDRFRVTNTGRCKVSDEESVVLQLSEDVVQSLDFMQVDKLSSLLFRGRFFSRNGFRSSGFCHCV